MNTKNKPSSKRKKWLYGICCALFFIASAGIITLKSQKQDKIIVQTSNIQETIKEQGITLRAVKTTENSDGTISKVFTYQIMPENATNQNINLTTAYEDGTNCNQVLLSSVNQQAKEITLHCLNEFNQKIVVTLIAESDPAKKATVIVDYVKKIKDVAYNQNTFYFSLQEENDIDYRHYLQFSYSKYTIDQSFRIRCDSVVLNNDKTYVSGGTISDSIYQDINLYLKQLLQNPTTPVSKDAIWEISDSNTWHSLLVANANSQSYLSYTIQSLSLEILNEQDEIQKTIIISNQTLRLYLDCDWEGFLVFVDEIVPEQSGIIF